MTRPIEIAIVDDGIPTDERIDSTHRISSSDLRFLLSLEWNAETALKSLFEALLEKKDWRVSAFYHPEFLLHDSEQDLYRPDVVVYDWDYPATSSDSPEMLKLILQGMFCVIGIFSVADKTEEIEAALGSKEIEPFKERILRVDKTDAKSHEKVAAKLNELFDANFSHHFGADLRHGALRAVERVLVELGKLSLKETIKLFADTDEEFNQVDFRDFIAKRIGSHLSEDSELIQFLEKEGVEGQQARELLSTIVEKLRNDLQRSINLQSISTSESAVSQDVAVRLWSYRLYYRPSDGFVRKGDIIVRKSEKSKSDVLNLVVSADCDLARFWKKNFGYVNFVPLHRMDSADQHVRDQFMMTAKEVEPADRVTSLANKAFKKSDDPIVLPFISIEGGSADFVLFPKEIKSAKITSSEKDFKKLREMPLKYSDCPEYELVCSLSEPFLTPVIEHLLSSIAGYGTPDYPKPLGELIKGRITGMNKSEGTKN